MPIFSKIQLKIQKIEASIIVQRYLDAQRNIGIYLEDSANISDVLVDEALKNPNQIWAFESDLIKRNPKFIAVVALAKGVKMFSINSVEQNACVCSLKELRENIEIENDFSLLEIHGCAFLKSLE